MKKEPFAYQYYMVLLAGLCTSMGYSMISGVIVKYVVSLGFSLTTAGFVSGLYASSALFVRPVGGMLSDRFHEKRLLRVSTPLFALCIFAYGLVPSLGGFAFIRIISGMVFAVNGTVTSAYACKFIPRSRTGEGIGYMGLTYTLSMAVAPGIGLSVFNSLGSRPAFCIAGCVIALATVFIMLIRDDMSPKSIGNCGFSFSSLIAVPLLPLAFINGLFSFCNGIIVNFIILHAEKNNIANPTVFFTVTAAVMLVVRPLAGKFNDRKGLPAVLIPAFIVSAAGMLFIGSLSSFFVMIAGAVLTSLGSGSGQPSIQAECVKRMPESQRGVAISTYFVFADLFQGFGPLIGGAIADAKGYTFTYNVCAAVLIGGLFLYLAENHFSKKRLSRV